MKCLESTETKYYHGNDLLPPTRILLKGVSRSTVLISGTDNLWTHKRHAARIRFQKPENSGAPSSEHPNEHTMNLREKWKPRHSFKLWWIWCLYKTVTILCLWLERWLNSPAFKVFSLVLDLVLRLLSEFLVRITVHLAWFTWLKSTTENTSPKLQLTFIWYFIMPLHFIISISLRNDIIFNCSLLYTTLIA